MTRDWKRRRRRLMALMAGLLMLGELAAATSPSRRFTLDALSPLASASELTSRLLTPLTQDRILKFREKVDFSFREQTIEVGEEPYELFVPEPAADGTYGLLVFIWPGDEIQVPEGWWKVLRDNHIIYVASRRSSNVENIFDRRVPLALHGYEYVRSRYRLAPGRVYIGGFSGGSRTAQRVMMAYPDVFHGVLLIGGSDPLGGESGFTLPSTALSRELQQHTRFVFSTGGNDSPNRAKDARTRKDLEALCMQGIRLVPQNGVEHWVPDGRGFGRALKQLEMPVSQRADAGACAGALDQSIQAQLDAVAAKVGSGELDEAGRLLARLDAHYGGLAAPRSVELARIIAEKAGLYELP